MRLLALSICLGLALAITAPQPVTAEGHSYITAANTLSSEDEAQLRQVIARLNHALDWADYDLYGSYFADDGVFVSGFGDAVGPSGVAAALEQVAPFITNKRHVAANLVISGGGDDAVVTSYLIVFEREESLTFVGSAINVDTMKRIAGAWKVVRHDSTLDPATIRYMQSLMQQ